VIPTKTRLHKWTQEELRKALEIVEKTNCQQHGVATKRAVLKGSVGSRTPRRDIAATQNYSEACKFESRGAPLLSLSNQCRHRRRLWRSRMSQWWGCAKTIAAGTSTICSYLAIAQLGAGRTPVIFQSVPVNPKSTMMSGLAAVWSLAMPISYRNGLAGLMLLMLPNP
jgi:hypothetical protein